jgi:hypothetical protein
MRAPSVIGCTSARRHRKKSRRHRSIRRYRSVRRRSPRGPNSRALGRASATRKDWRSLGRRRAASSATQTGLFCRLTGKATGVGPVRRLEIAVWRKRRPVRPGARSVAGSGAWGLADFSLRSLGWCCFWPGSDAARWDPARRRPQATFSTVASRTLPRQAGLVSTQSPTYPKAVRKTKVARYLTGRSSSSRRTIVRPVPFAPRYEPPEELPEMPTAAPISIPPALNVHKTRIAQWASTVVATPTSTESRSPSKGSCRLVPTAERTVPTTSASATRIALPAFPASVARRHPWRAGQTFASPGASVESIRIVARAATVRPSRPRTRKASTEPITATRRTIPASTIRIARRPVVSVKCASMMFRASTGYAANQSCLCNELVTCSPKLGPSIPYRDTLLPDQDIRRS